MTIYTHVQDVTYIADGATIVNTTFTYSGDSETGIQETITGSTTNKEFYLPFTVAQIQSLVMWSNQALTIKTNSSGSPQDTINLVANKQLIWDTDSPPANIPFAGDVTAIFVTNAGMNTAQLVIRVLLNVAIP